MSRVPWRSSSRVFGGTPGFLSRFERRVRILLSNVKGREEPNGTRRRSLGRAGLTGRGEAARRGRDGSDTMRDGADRPASQYDPLLSRPTYSLDILGNNPIMP